MADRRRRILGVVGQVVFAVLSVSGFIFGIGAAGVAIAWLNDKRQVALARQMPQQTPREILEKRFAKREIDEAEFNRRLSRLLLGPTLELD